MQQVLKLGKEISTSVTNLCLVPADLGLFYQWVGSVLRLEAL